MIHHMIILNDINTNNIYIVRCKRSTFWTDRVEEERAQPRRLWQSFDEILGRGRAPPTDIDAPTLHRYFDDKVAGVRAATAGAAPPSSLLCLPVASCESLHRSLQLKSSSW